MTILERLRAMEETEKKNAERWNAMKGEKGMQYVVVMTNDLSCDQTAKGKALEALKSGAAVHIDSNCVGHTRAAMVEIQGINYLKSLGAHKVGNVPARHSWLGDFYAL